jgi:hypothetical protein
MKPISLLVVALAVLALQGCSLFGSTRTIYTPLPIIPVGEAPPLTGHEASDFPILAADALRSRNLINRYNRIARAVNEKHGAEDTTLESIDVNLPDPPTPTETPPHE